MDPLLEQQLSRLLQQAQEGDRVAYRQFLRLTREVVLALLRNRLRSAATLEDIVQETLLSIHRSRHTYDPARPVGPWIRAIAFNRLRDSGRARKRRPDTDTTNMPELPESNRKGADDASEPTWLRSALGTLTNAQREVIWLLKFEGYSVAEVAALTGRSASAIKVTAHRGYKALRALLGTP